MKNVGTPGFTISNPVLLNKRTGNGSASQFLGALIRATAVRKAENTSAETKKESNKEGVDTWA